MGFFFSTQPFIAVIGDIKGSRELQNRNAVQEKLRSVLYHVNELYKDDIVSKFTITLGDEFQVLLENGANIMHIISKINKEMFPVKIRYGIGLGTITTGIDRNVSIGADGPGYYKAREAIEYLKSNEKKKGMGLADVRFEFDGGNPLSQRMINTILLLMTEIQESWSDRQREIIWDMLEYGESQANTAKRLNIQQPTIAKALERGRFFSYKEALGTIEKALEEIKQNGI